MSDPQSTGDTGYPGQQRVQDSTSDFNKMHFLIRQLLGWVRTATLVRVDKVSVEEDSVSEVGFVDVTPLVNMLDGQNKSSEHITVFNLPYFRLQGGTNAIIMDPVVGDIGLAVFADRDISIIKKTKDRGNPGSRRRFSFSDGMYIGGFLNAVPEQYVQFKSDGMKLLDKNGNQIVMSPDGISFADSNGNTLDMKSTGFEFTGNVAITGTLKDNGVPVGSTHTHTGVTSGGDTSGTPTP